MYSGGKTRAAIFRMTWYRGSTDTRISGACAFRTTCSAFSIFSRNSFVNSTFGFTASESRRCRKTDSGTSSSSAGSTVMMVQSEPRRDDVVLSGCNSIRIPLFRRAPPRLRSVAQSKYGKKAAYVKSARKSAARIVKAVYLRTWNMIQDQVVDEAAGTSTTVQLPVEPNVMARTRKLNSAFSSRFLVTILLPMVDN